MPLWIWESRTSKLRVYDAVEAEDGQAGGEGFGAFAVAVHEYFVQVQGVA